MGKQNSYAGQESEFGGIIDDEKYYADIKASKCGNKSIKLLAKAMIISAIDDLVKRPKMQNWKIYKNRVGGKAYLFIYGSMHENEPLYQTTKSWLFINNFGRMPLVLCCQVLDYSVESVRKRALYKLSKKGILL